MKARPKLKIKLTHTDNIVEIAVWLLLILLWALPIWKYSNLPELIPSNYNFSGHPDYYSAKSSIFLMPIIGTILFIVFTVLGKFPHIYDYPTEITTDNALKLYTIVTRMMRFLKLSIILVCLLIVFEILQTVDRKSHGFGIWVTLLALGLIFIPIVFFYKKIIKIS